MILQGRLLSDPRRRPEPGWLEVEGDRIVEIGAGDPPRSPESGDDSTIICPGFIDAHVHLPQVDAIGGDGLTLLDWLERVIYPVEQEWADKGLAEAQARRAYEALLRVGTLGYAGFLTSHPHAVMAVTKAAHDLPLRGIAGQVLMDREGPPDLIGLPAARLARSERGRLDTSLNPRFAVACSDELLARTGRTLAEGFPFSFKQREEGEMGTRLFLQTHLAETVAECARVRELFPEDAHYAGVYDRHGLLTPNTLLAHGLHLGEDEWKLIARRDSVVVHCPGANTFLQSGLFDLNAARAHGVRLGLGSDVAAGCDLAMPRVARSMIEVAKLRRLTIDPEAHVPGPAEAWDLITRGNADVLGFHDLGRIEVGASADLLLLNVPFEIDAHLIGRLIHTWRDEFIASRIVRGRHIHMD